MDLKMQRRDGVLVEMVKHYKLEFGVEPIEDIDAIFFETTWEDEELVMLIKVWMYKLAEIVEEYVFYEDEMMELLETFGHKQVPIFSVELYHSADMYEIWEAANIKPTFDDMENPKFWNEEAQKVFQKVIKRNKKEERRKEIINDKH
jgi:hypothetical protein